MKKPTIAMLWMEGPLSYLEQLCVKSFVDAGHPVVLYHYGPLQNVPDGVELANADDILPRTNFLTHERTGSPALHSDVFRYRMLEKSDNTIWADTDAYCYRPFETPNGHFYGWESSKHVNGGVLGLPRDSDTLRELLAFTRDEFSIPTYYGEEYAAELAAKKAAGNPVHAGEQPWGVWGPHAVTHFLHSTGEIKYALPQEALYPFTFKDRRLMLRRNLDTTPYITENTYSVHLYGRRMRARLVEKEGGKPHRRSLLGQLLIRHGIDPDLAPIPNKGKPEDIKTEAAPAAETPKAVYPAATVPAADIPAATPAPNATAPAPGTPEHLGDLADRLGTDIGPRKHRYTDLYQLLFQPLRTRPASVLVIGHPGSDIPEGPARSAANLPLLSLWSQAFPQARITRLDSAPIHGIEETGVSLKLCNFDDPASIRAAAAQVPGGFDLILDDGSHASHHQQNALMALFDLLRPGGIYVLEDLRAQPDALELPGMTKTADLLQSYLTQGEFQHVNPEVAARFNTMRDDISGCFVFQAMFDKTRKDQLGVLHRR